MDNEIWIISDAEYISKTSLLQLCLWIYDCKIYYLMHTNNYFLTGYLFPKGWCIMTSFTSIHLDQENYENPCQFDPWRWQVSMKLCIPFKREEQTTHIILAWLTEEREQPAEYLHSFWRWPKTVSRNGALEVGGCHFSPSFCHQFQV